MNPFRDVIGNRHVTDALSVAIDAARQENRLPGHILLSGPAGTGKTKFSEMIAQAMEASLSRIHGPSITRRNIADLTKALITLEDNTVLFIDEIHALPKECMECLYEAMEQKQVSITVPTDDGGVKIITMKLNRFVLVGATTDPGKLTEPLRDRFNRRLTLTEYTSLELFLILEQYQARWHEQDHGDAREIHFNAGDLQAIADRSRGRARNALELLSVCRDHILTGSTVEAAFAESGVGAHGQTHQDEAYISILANVFQNGPAGIEAMVSASGLKRETIERVIEPFLLSKGIIRRTPRGRILIGEFR